MSETKSDNTDRDATSYFKRQFISKAGMDQLDRYKYIGGEYSWLDKKMNGFWLWCSELLPMWMAPNLVTFIGFLFIISQAIITLYYDLSLSRELPNWVFGWSALSAFIYQTLDAVDGKQARRTKSSSPLGQLFDHGCDSFALTFFLLSASQAAKIDSQTVFYIMVCVQFTLFTANWTEYHTHVLQTQVANFGVTEAQFIVIFINLGSFYGGQNFWAYKVGEVVPQSVYDFFVSNGLEYVLNNQIYVYIASFVILFTGLATVVCIFSVLFGEHKDKEGQPVKVKKEQALFQWIPILSIVAIELHFFGLKDLYAEYAGIILVSFGFLISLITCKLIICSLTHMKFPTFHFEVLPYYALYFTVTKFFPELMTLQNQFIGMCAVTLFTLFSIFYYTSSVIEQITKHLGIFCFNLNKRPKQD